MIKTCLKVILNTIKVSLIFFKKNPIKRKRPIHIFFREIREVSNNKEKH